MPPVATLTPDVPPFSRLACEPRPAALPWCAAVAVLVVFLALTSGCGSPNAANNKLRADNAQLETQVEQLKNQVEAERASIKALEQKIPTVATLPQARLDKLFTVYGIKLGRLTGGDDWDS